MLKFSYLTAIKQVFNVSCIIQRKQNYMYYYMTYLFKFLFTDEGLFSSADSITYPKTF